MLLNSVMGVLVNLFSNQAEPLSKTRNILLKFVNKLCLTPALFCCGFRLKVVDKRINKLKNPALKLCNHHGLTDILCLGAFGTDCMIANKNVT